MDFNLALQILLESADLAQSKGVFNLDDAFKVKLAKDEIIKFLEEDSKKENIKTEEND